MTKLEQIQAAEKKLLLQTYDRNPLLLTGGKGVHVYDESGAEYLDLLSGIGVTALGYAHPAVEKAITEQAKKLLHTSNLFYHEHTAELAMRLTEMSGLDRRVPLQLRHGGVGGRAEAGACTRRRTAQRRQENRHEVSGAGAQLPRPHHGRPWPPRTRRSTCRAGFAPVMPDVEFVRFDDVVADLRAKFSGDVCGICIEAIQGEGGVRPVSKEFFAAARELCDSTGALLLADEIQSGMGRTGEWFAYQHYGIQPDITTLAKPIANGLPMGAMLSTDEAARAISPGMHGTTFGGGPLVCAVAIAVIDTMKQQKLLAHVREVGSYFKQQLEALRKEARQHCEVRGLGLMLGVELDSAELAKRAAGEMMAQRIIINRTSETVLRFLPPFVLERKHIDQAVAALDGILAAAMAGQSPAGEHKHG